MSARTKNAKPATWIQCDGTETEVFPRNGKDFKLDELHNFCRTRPDNDHVMIQIVPLHSLGLILVCEEEAMMKRLPPNPTATMKTAVDVYQGPKGIQGDVLICDYNHVK